MAPRRVDPRCIDLGIRLPERLLYSGSLSRFTRVDDKLPTGIASLDRVLRGGFARRCMHYIQGEETSGKSFFCERMAKIHLETSDGIVFIAGIQGEHPMPGGPLLALSEDQKDRCIIFYTESIAKAFLALEMVLSHGPSDCLAFFDDLTSLSGEDSVPYKAILQGLNRVRSHLSSGLSLILVAQVRNLSPTELVGATAYSVLFSQAETGIHLYGETDKDRGLLIIKHPTASGLELPREA